MLDEFKHKIEITAYQNRDSTTIQKSLKPWWLRLLHPVALIGLIKRYHLVSSWFFLLFIGQPLILIHLLIKLVVQTFYTGADPERQHYLDSVYYPHLAGTLPEPHHLNSVMLSEICCCLCVRLLSAYKLIKGSILNEHKYKDINVTQVNLAALTACELTVKEWIEVFKSTIKHDARIKINPAFRRSHLRINFLNHPYLEQLTEKELLIQLNIIDFDQCFDNVQLFDPSKRKKRYQEWHYALPFHKWSPSMLRLQVVCAFLIGGSLLIFQGLIIIGTIYLELASTARGKQMASFNELVSVFKYHFSQPIYLIRIFELLALIVCQLPRQFDCLLVIMDQCLLIGRARKLAEAFEADLEICRNKIFASKFEYKEEFPKQISFRGKLLLSREQQQFENRCRSNDIRKLNDRIQSYIKLISLLHAEFLSIRKTHSALINMIIIGDGICLTYILSKILVEPNISVRIILGVGLLSNSANCLNALLFSATIESVFKHLYKLMARFRVNQSGALTTKTIELLMIGSEAFEDERDRSFLLADLYAITLDSVTPVSSQDHSLKN